MNGYEIATGRARLDLRVERRDAWMDEGFNTFIDVYEADNFNRGEFAPKRDSEYAPKGGNPVDEIRAC